MLCVEELEEMTEEELEEIELRELDAVMNEKIKGFLMLNPDNNIEIKCTKKFVKYWERLGFEIVDERIITLCG